MRRLIALFLLLPSLVWADDWDALKQPGAVALMRHALAPGTGDPARFELRDCATQRNLDARGRAQARATGQALKQRGIAFDQVLSSQWCRTLETARLLGLGPVQEAPSLNSFFGSFEDRAPQTRASLELLRRTPGRLMLVTHQVNITALTGRGVGSGEIIFIRMGEAGVEVLGSAVIAP